MLIESWLAMGAVGVFFSADDGGGGGGPAPVTTPAPVPAPRVYTEVEYNALASERNTLATERDSVKTKLTTYEQSQLTEQQKAETKATEADQKREAAEARALAAQERVVKAEFKVAAKDAGIVDPDLALLAIKDKIEFDDAGEPKNIAALLDQLVKDKPYLAAPAGNGGVGLTPGAARNGNGGQQTATQKIDEDFAKRRGNTSSGFRIG